MQNKIKRFSSGFSQIPIILGLVLMLIALPIAISLSQKTQDNRNRATDHESLCNGTCQGASCSLLGRTTGVGTCASTPATPYCCGAPPATPAPLCNGTCQGASCSLLGRTTGVGTCASTPATPYCCGAPPATPAPLCNGTCQGASCSLLGRTTGVGTCASTPATPYCCGAPPATPAPLCSGQCYAASCSSTGKQSATGTCSDKPTTPYCCIAPTATPRPPLITNTPIPTGIPGGTNPTSTPGAGNPNPTSPPSGGGSCPYSNLQARVQAVAGQPLTQSITITAGAQAGITCTYNGTGTFASNVKLVATHNTNSAYNKIWNASNQSGWIPEVGVFTVKCQSTDSRCNNLTSDTSTVTVNAAAGANCKQCPATFACFGNPTYGYKWFSPGYEATGYTAAVSQYCINAGLAQPTYKGKSRGDANCDGSINILDYSIWRKEHLDISNGGNVVRSTWEADFTGNGGSCDGVVNVYDYSLWRSNYLN